MVSIIHFRLIAVLVLFFVTPLHAQQATTWLEAEGVVNLEVEDATIGKGWLLKRAIGGYSGSGYIEWGDRDYLGKQVAGNGKMSYQILIETPGNYELRWRSRIAKGSNRTEHNDSWVRFPTASNVSGEQPLSGWTKVFLNRSGGWFWDSRTVDGASRPLRQFFSRGLHRVEISGRSNGHAIDKLVLYRYGARPLKDAALDALPASRTTTDPVGAMPIIQPPSPTPLVPAEPFVVQNPDSAAPEADNNNGGTTPVSATTPPEPDPAVIAKPAEAEVASGVCDNNMLSLSPTVDVYVEGGNYIDNAILRVEPENRLTLLQYDLSGTPMSQTAELRFTVGTDGGSGELNLFLGSHSDWPGAQAAGNVPDKMVLLGSSTGSWSANSTYSVSIDASVLPASIVTVLVDMGSGANDIAMRSSATSFGGPSLRLSGDSNFCTDYALMKAQDSAVAAIDGNLQSTGEAGSGMNSVPQNNEQTNGETNGAPQAGAASAVSDSTSSAGGVGTCLLLLMAIFSGLRFQLIPARIRRVQITLGFL